MEIDIEGWYSTGKQYPDLKSIYLPIEFKISAKRFELKNLKVLQIEKFVGKTFNLTKVVGVVDVKGSLTPFFVTEEKAKKLKNLLGSALISI